MPRSAWTPTETILLPQATAASWNRLDTSTFRRRGRHIPSMRLASFTAEPTTVKSSRSLVPMLP